MHRDISSGKCHEEYHEETKGGHNDEERSSDNATFGRGPKKQKIELQGKFKKIGPPVE